MRYLRDESGDRLFTFDEFLRPTQITSYFSRLASKRKKINVDELSAQNQQQLQEKVCHDVYNALSHKVAKHPILFSRHNLCLVQETELMEFKITQLRAISNHFDIKVKSRKKLDFVTAIINFLDRCSCKAK